MDMQEEASRLFRKYRDALRGEFLTQEEAQAADTTAKVFAGKLDELGFMVAAHVSSMLSYERVKTGETITIITYFFDLSLVPKGTPLTKTEIAAKRVAVAEAVAKVYGSQPAVPPPREGEWNFTERERHAFLGALGRHGEKLVQSCKKEGITLALEDWTIILAGVGAMTIGIDDTFIFNCLLEAEVLFLEKYGSDHELEDCPCQAGEHITALKAWESRNITRRR